MAHHDATAGLKALGASCQQYDARKLQYLSTVTLMVVRLDLKIQDPAFM